MKKKMEEIEVSFGGDNIFITQTDSLHDGEAIIMIHPEQIDLLIQWLREAREAAKEKGKN